MDPSSARFNEKTVPHYDQRNVSHLGQEISGNLMAFFLYVNLPSSISLFSLRSVIKGSGPEPFAPPSLQTDPLFPLSPAAISFGFRNQASAGIEGIQTD
jgi:hypothetical protein